MSKLAMSIYNSMPYLLHHFNLVPSNDQNIVSNLKFTDLMGNEGLKKTGHRDLILCIPKVPQCSGGSTSVDWINELKLHDANVCMSGDER